MAGREVTRQELDSRIYESLVSLKDSVQRLEAINEFLATVPPSSDGKSDPLTESTTPTDSMEPSSAPGKFGYTPEEAALIREVFGSLLSLRKGLDPVLKTSRKLTGLD